MKKYRYKVCNLDCPNCAKKVEDRLNKESNLEDVVLNFSNLTLSFKSDDNIKLVDIIKKAREIEPDINILNINEENNNKNYRLIRLIVGVFIVFLSFIIKNIYIKEILIVLANIILLYNTFKTAIHMLIKSHIINENMLITISCIGAYLINEKMEGLMVIILYEIGKVLEEKAVNKSRNSIKELMDISQDYANVIKDGKESKINVEDVNINDILLIKKGEKIPVDGIIIEGNTDFDLSSLTGESLPVSLKKSDEVLSGSINIGEIIKIKATKKYVDSTVSKILSLIEEASDKKSKTENYVTKISKYYTPIVIIISIFTFIILNTFKITSMNEAIYRSLTFLVISCPCAIAISIPLSYFTSIGISSKYGILIKGSNYLDMLSNVKNIVFDKTGTLTNGTFKINNFEIINNNYSEEYIKELYVKVEQLSNHPIAKSIVNYFNINTKSDIDDFKEIEGMGISCKYKNKTIKIGNNKILSKKIKSDKNKIYLQIDNELVSYITISDGIKEGVIDTVKNLKKNKINLYMFTGDIKQNALMISNKLGIDNVEYELLPTDKYKKLDELINYNYYTMFIGDGINDAPSLKRADIGVSMGQIGSSSAIDASDIVIMDDDISKINKSIEISKYTKKIIKQNLIFALSVKLSILILCIFGLSTMFEAVFADVGVTVLCILNTLRIMKK